MNKILHTGEYFGNTIRSATANGLVLTESFFAPFNELPAHYHINPYLCYVVRGGYTERTGKQQFDCKKDDIVVHAAKIVHENKFDKTPSVCFNIEFNDSWMAHLQEYGIGFDKTYKLSGSSSSFLLHKIYNEFREFNSLSGLMIEGLMSEALVDMARGKSVYRPNAGAIKKTVELIKEHFDEDITLTCLANAVNIHPAHLARTFKKSTGLTIGEFKRNFRINKAASMLRQTKADILAIAIQCGFADQSYFTKIFKKITGVTPAEYRRKR
jgi:AraC family transcriptional regulator